MPPTLTLVIVLPTVIAVVVLFGALSLVGLLDPSDPALRAMGAAPAPEGCQCLCPLQLHPTGSPRPAPAPRAPCAAHTYRTMPVGRLAVRP